ncbi:hypothetical protein Btru_075659 [Bulinus truncatus]|nr:hypothetical protein Btru_075659 [Bulinus truncatus]
MEKAVLNETFLSAIGKLGTIVADEEPSCRRSGSTRSYSSGTIALSPVRSDGDTFLSRVVVTPFIQELSKSDGDTFYLSKVMVIPFLSKSDGDTIPVKRSVGDIHFCQESDGDTIPVSGKAVMATPCPNLQFPVMLVVSFDFLSHENMMSCFPAPWSWQAQKIVVNLVKLCIAHSGRDILCHAVLELGVLQFLCLSPVTALSSARDLVVVTKFHVPPVQHHPHDASNRSS